MTMALRTATCNVCGDGDLQEDEQCDDGTANSNEPGAACRTNCRLPFCGDGVVPGQSGCRDQHPAPRRRGGPLVPPDATRGTATRGTWAFFFVAKFRREARRQVEKLSV